MNTSEKTFDEFGELVLELDMARIIFAEEEEEEEARIVVSIKDITERKRAEEALRESEERYRTVARLSSEFAYSCIHNGDDGYEVDWITDAFFTLTNYSEAELHEQRCWLFVSHPDDLEMATKPLRELKAGESDTREFRIVTKGGRVLYIVSHMECQVDPKAHGGLRLFGAVQNITEPKKAEEALRRAEENFRRSLDDSPLGVRIVTIEGETIYANRAILDIYDFDSIEELETTPVEKRYTPESYAEFRIRRKKRRQGVDVPSEYEVSIVRENGEIRHLQVFRKEILWDGERQFQVIYQDITERKRMEEELRERAIQLKKLTSWVPGMIYQFTKRPDGTYCVPFTTEAIKDIYGCLPKDVREDFSPITRVILPEDFDKVVGSIEYSANHLTIWTCEYRVQIPGQSIRWLLGNSTPEKLADGGITWYGFNTDITDRKQAEEALRKSREKYQGIIENMQEGYHEVDIKGNFTSCNESMRKIIGYEREELLGMNNRQYADEENIHKVYQVYNRVYRTGEPVKNFEWQIIRKDGDRRDIEVSISLIRDAESHPTGFRGIVRDITERKQTEEALRKSQEQLREAHRLAHIGVWNWVAETDTVLWTEELYSIAGLDPMLPAPTYAEHSNIYAPESWDLLKEAVERAMKTGETYQLELKLIRLDGTTRWVNAFGGPTNDDHGRIEGLQGTVQDITDRKLAEEELRTSRMQLRALATRLQQIREEERVMISREVHDEMGGGLTGLKMDLSWLLRKMGDADPGEERVALMDKIHTSNALIDQMIRVVRRISTDLRPSVLDDLGLIAALEWHLSEFTSRTEIPHEFSTTFEYVNLEEDIAVDVFRIFQEALTNVMRHSRATKVAVVLREGERSLLMDEHFVLEIRDNGRGITEEEILNPKSLGLLGMKERVLSFGGEFSIRGEPGGGTALVVQIPRKQGEPS